MNKVYSSVDLEIERRESRPVLRPPQKSTWTDSYHRRKEMWALYTAQ